MDTVPKELYDELMEKYIDLVRENEWLKSASWSPTTPDLYPPNSPWKYPRIWCRVS